ncbi:maltose acetyltransferase domain-containing protein, partial [Escherichia coli]|uniref:maltose acetyltransferase domain-containing protein n=1 Tax=Escherichia coli TaxID=562 RepID=UPI002377F8A3
MNMSMTERIKAGKLFTDMCEGLPEKRLRGKTLMYEFNHSHPSEVEKRESLLKEMFATVGNDSNLLIVFYVQIMPDDFVMQLHR